MEKEEYIRIFTGSSIMGNLLKTRLEEASISPIVKNETESARLAGFGPSVVNQVQVFVHKDEHQDAKKILSEVENELKKEEK